MNNSKIDLSKIATPYTPTVPRCINCRYWSALVIGEKYQAGDQGECRLHPPSAHMVMAATVGGDRPAILPGSMRVRADHWCGDHPTIRCEENARMVASVNVAKLRTDWEAGLLRDADGKFTRIPTLAEARSFMGARGEPDNFAKPVEPVAGALPLEDGVNPLNV